MAATGLRPGDSVALLLAAMMLLVPAVGVPHEFMLQDTLKSMLVALGTLSAAGLLLWQHRRQHGVLLWHGILWLPLLLMAYALASMVWSHSYLAGVEAIRWFVFAALLWVGLNTLTQERLPLLVNGIHWGAVLASLWAALQFWLDWSLFPQGAAPSSSFINRNFFAEFVVCTLPFSFWLLLQARGSGQIALRAFFLSFNLVALMMSGTRSALLAVLLQLPVLAVIVWLYRDRFEARRWRGRERLLAVLVVLATLVVLGGTRTGSPTIGADGLGETPLQRSYMRAKSVTSKEEYTQGSVSVRLLMWKSTVRMIVAHPLAGVGAGAWEVQLPRYQDHDELLENDFYAHNEILQLLAEYGLAGWLFLLALLGYLSRAAWRTWRDPRAMARREAPLRALTLTSLLAFLIVSCAGFPWRMASTGALFALALAALGASDARLGWRGRSQAQALPWSPHLARLLMALNLACLVFALYISRQAAVCERDLVTALKLAATISNSSDPTHPRWDPVKAKMLELLRAGIAINPHYRKITPMVGDHLARWGDWARATWVWESVLASRPYVTGLLTNVARGYAQMDELDKARSYLARAQALRPNATAVQSLEVILLSRAGRQREAVALVKGYLQHERYDLDLVTAAYVLGMRSKDWPLALQGLRLRNQKWPQWAWDGWLKMGNIYALPEVGDEAKALEAYRAALAAADPVRREQVRQMVPPAYRARL